MRRKSVSEQQSAFDTTAEKQQKKERRKVHRSGRFYAMLAGIFLLCLLFYIGWRFFFNPKTITLVRSEMVEQTREGKGAFFYHEYAPDVFRGLTVPIKNLDTTIRYRVEKALFPLDEALRRKIESASARLAASEEASYMKQMLQANAVTMPFSGLVKTEIDGYETLFQPESLSVLQPGDIGTAEGKAVREKGLKFVDNRLFYVAMDCPQSVLPLSVKVGTNYPIKTEKNVFLSGTLVRRVSDAQGRNLLIFALRDGYQRLQEARFASLRLILEEAESYRIPISCVFHEGEKTYCFILDKNHVAQKIPVRITGVDEKTDEFFIAPVPSKNASKVLSRFDRVIRKPTEVKEGGLYRWD
ncbi:HlyD family efflux transporter periplasmic adaptor subunit [Levyella massiliensis]|uniref:HlyD family efflux transporter periplasmic adaptor subunit n=1 Tax=Levyella massiliensis TaxID=938289 RepID=UPI0003723D41|nr:HlyD family efflux transporter periplasmic adaptor subunit [Levyella massiliensis]